MQERQKAQDVFIETHRQTILDALDFFTLAFGSLCALKLLSAYDGGMSAGLAGGAAAGSVIVKHAIEKRYPASRH